MDPVAPVCMLMLSAIGVAFIYSSQDYTGGDLWVKQVIWMGISVAAYAIFSILHYKILLENALWIYIASIVLLLAVKSPLGTEIYGARRWIDLKFTTLQPSELANMATLIMLARTLSRFTNHLSILLLPGPGYGHSALPTLIIFCSPTLVRVMLPFMISSFIQHGLQEVLSSDSFAGTCRCCHRRGRPLPLHAFLSRKLSASKNGDSRAIPGP